MPPTLVTDFASLSEAAFLAIFIRIVACLTGNPHFPEPWPAPLPGTAALKVALDAFQLAFAAAKGRDPEKVAIRDGQRVTNTETLQSLSHYLMLVAGGNLAALESTGYGLRHTPVKSQSHDPPAAPAHVAVAPAG